MGKSGRLNSYGINGFRAFLIGGTILQVEVMCMEAEVIYDCPGRLKRDQQLIGSGLCPHDV